MTNELILMPLRIGIRVANVCVRPVVSVAEQLLELTGRMRDTTDRHEAPGERSAKAAPASSAPSTRARESAAPSRPTDEILETSDRAPEAAALEPEPRHVSEQPEIVSEFAEPGAEDGAGAEMRVDEPWPGYGQLTADQVIERLTASSPEELAVVELYELSNRNRGSVVSAVERELKRATAGRPAS